MIDCPLCEKKVEELKPVPQEFLTVCERCAPIIQGVFELRRIGKSVTDDGVSDLLGPLMADAGLDGADSKDNAIYAPVHG